MTTKKDLQKEIAELTEKHNLQTMVEKKLPGLDVSTYIHRWKNKNTYRVSIDLSKDKPGGIAEKIQDILTAFPPTKNNKLSFAGKDNIETGSPYHLRFGNHVDRKEVEISYYSGGNDVDIKIPLDFYSPDTKEPFFRGVTDCEYHYFGGVSMTEIRKMSIRCFKSRLFETAKYFGGDCVTHILKDAKPETRAKFETFVLNGHYPEHVSKWKQTLIDNDKTQ